MSMYITRFVFPLVVGSMFVGCGDGASGAAKRAPVYKANGKVTYLGSPLVGAVVTFAPQEQQPAAIGRTNDAGEFQLTTYGGGDGAAAGEFKVLIVLNDSAASAAPQDAHTTLDPKYSPPNTHSASVAKASGSLLPAKFGDQSQTPLTAKVEPSGANNFTFDLK
jgi:hypothetical protein